MAKELTPAEVVAFFTKNNLPVPEDLQKKVANEKEDNAVQHISERIVSNETKDAARWQKNLFTLATNMTKEFKFQEKNVGQGQKNEAVVTIETNEGTLTVRLRKDVVKK